MYVEGSTLRVWGAGLGGVERAMATHSSRKPTWNGQKENQPGQESPAEKKRKLAGKEAASGVKLRTHRTAFAMVGNTTPNGKSSMINSTCGTPSKNSAAMAAADGSSTAAAEVEALLSMKMVGKTKFDFKVNPRNSLNAWHDIIEFSNSCRPQL